MSKRFENRNERNRYDDDDNNENTLHYEDVLNGQENEEMTPKERDQLRRQRRQGKRERYAA